MVNPSRFASDPRIDKPWGSTLREKLPRSVRLRYVNWGSKECQQPPPKYMSQQLKPQFCIYSYISFKEPFGIFQLDSTNGTAQALPFLPHKADAEANVALD